MRRPSAGWRRRLPALRSGARAVWPAATLLLAAGCGAHGVGAVASHTLRALDAGASTVSLVGIDALELPADGELVIKPRLLSLDASSLGDEVPVRVQIVLRGVRHDGGVFQWFVGADGRAPAGEQAFQLAPGHSSREAFGGADYGPVRVDSLAGLEVSVALVPAGPTNTARFVGLGAVRELSSRGAEAHAGLRAAVEADGATLVMASRLSVEPRADVAPGHYEQRLVVVGTAAAFTDTALRRLHSVDGVRLKDQQGAAVSDVSFLVLELHVEVPDHSQ